MATLQGMSGIDLRALVAELADHLPLWVGKIYQFDAKTLGIRLNGEGHAKYLFLIEAGRRAHLVESFPTPPRNPPGFAMLLRKYLEGGRVLGIRQPGLERTFVLDVGRRDTTYRLITELFDEGNVILCDASNTIIKPLWHHRFRNREVVPGAHYDFAGTDCSQVSSAGFREILQASQRDVVRTLAIACMLGGRYAEEVCRRAGVEKTMPAPQADAGALHTALMQLLEQIEERREPIITASGCWPIVLDKETVLQRFDTFNEALDAFYPKAWPVEAAAEAEKTRLAEEAIIRKRQLNAIAAFEKKIERSERVVEALYGHYTEVADIIRTLDEVSRQKSWQEIERILKESDHPAARMIRAVHPAEAAVELDVGGERALVHVHETVDQNIGRYYDQIKKFKRKRAGALAALDRKFVRKATRKQQPLLQKKRWFHRFRWFTTSDGVLVLGGRDASQNEEIVRRYMEGGDTFVHADVHGGSVVVVKGTTSRMEEVAQFAASFSSAWKAGHATADVYAARPDQVSKTPESGEYVARGAFVVRGERTYFRNVPLGIAIGIQFEPDVAIIGGPPAVVAERAKVWVELRPGQFEPNDTAKKVVRALRQQLSEEEQKSLRSVLNTEAVAAFVPPGGSDLVGV